jgi:hypothetical protein
MFAVMSAAAIKITRQNMYLITVVTSEEIQLLLTWQPSQRQQLKGFKPKKLIN